MTDIQNRKVFLLTPFNDALVKVQIFVGVILMGIFVALTVGEIFSRYLLAKSLIWAPEVATMALIWSVFMGSSVCFRNNSHLAVDFFAPKSDGGKRLHFWFVSACNLVYLALVAWFACVALPIGMRRGTPILDIPLAYGWVVFVVLGIAGISYTIENLILGRVLDEPDTVAAS